MNKDLPFVQQWISDRVNKEQKIGAASGKLRNFIIEPFVPHKSNEETYVCIYSHRFADTILFYHEGGVDVGDVDSKAVRLDIPVGGNTNEAEIEKVSNYVILVDTYSVRFLRLKYHYFFYYTNSHLKTEINLMYFDYLDI